MNKYVYETFTTSILIRDIKAISKRILRELS